MAAVKLCPLVCPGSHLPAPASPRGGLAEAALRGLLVPGDPDAAVGRSQLDRPGEQHCVGGAVEGLRPDAQGGDGQEAGQGWQVPSGFRSRGRRTQICRRLQSPHRGRPGSQPRWLS